MSYRVTTVGYHLLGDLGVFETEALAAAFVFERWPAAVTARFRDEEDGRLVLLVWATRAEVGGPGCAFVDVAAALDLFHPEIWRAAS